MKRIAILAAAAVGLAGLALLAMPLLVSPDLLRQRIADRISAATGRTVSIAGEPGLSIYPHLAVSVGGMTIANAQGLGEDPFVTAESMTTRLRLLPLIAGRMEFDAFTLVRPRIHLVRYGDGRVNWQMPRDEAGRSSVTDLALGRLQIAGGTVVYDNLASKRHEETTAVDLDLVWPTAADAAGVSGSLQWRGETVEFNGTVAKPSDLIDGDGSPVRFAIASTPLRVSFNGRAAGPDNFRLEGDASVTTPSLRRAVAWLGTPTGNGSILGPASVEGTMRWLGSTITFSAVKVELDGNEAQGALALDVSGERPALQGTVAASKLDLSPYFEAMRADLSAAGPWPFAPTRLPLADLLDCDLRLSASQVLVGDTRFDNVAATAAIRGGAVTLNIGEARVFGGRLDARLVAAMQGETLVGNLRARLAAVLAQAPLGQIADVSALSGRADATFELGGRGANWGAFARSLAGNASIEIADGSLTGFAVGEIATRLADPLADPVPAGDGVTPFKRLAGRVAIENGMLATNDLSMAGNDYRIDLSGRGSLVTGMIEAKAKLAMTGGDATAAIPLAVTGSWRAPLIGPDDAAAEREGGAAVVIQPPG